LRQLASRYRQFPLYNMPYSLVGNFAAGFIAIALTAFHYTQPAGLLTLARRVIYAPVSLISASLGQVFFQEAAVAFGTPRLESLTTRLLEFVADTATPALVFGLFWAPEMFAFVFGEPWRAGGEYARAFAPVAFCFLFTSWPERIYEVAQRQHIALTLQIISDGVSIGLLLLLLQTGISPLTSVRLYALAYTLYHITYLYIVFRIAGFGPLGLAKLAARIAVLGCISTLALATMRMLVPNASIEFAAGLVFVGSLVVISLSRRLRRG
jgi:O-antigen/teichoic acid export membrane protein